MSIIIPPLGAFPWEKVRADLRRLSPSRIRKQTMLPCDSGEAFFVRAPLEDLLRLLEYWYAVILCVFDRMITDTHIVETSEDIFKNDPRIETTTFYDSDLRAYECTVRIRHRGERSYSPLGKAIIVRRTQSVYEACLTNLDWIEGLVRLLCGDFSGEDVEVLSEEEYGEIRINGGRIIYTESENE